MKRCPTCQITYADDSLLYCLSDGAALIDNVNFDPRATLSNDLQSTLRDDNRATLPDDDPVTLLYTSARSANQPPVAAPRVNTPPGGWNPAPAWTPPAPYLATPLRRRSYAPWIIGAAALLALGIIIMVIVASRRSSAGTPAANNSNSANQSANRNAGPPSPNENANQSSAGGNTNRRETTNGNSTQQVGEAESPPTDPDLVLSQLTAIEHEWNDANIKGNKVAVRRIVADEFRGVGADGSVENKEQMLAHMEPSPQIASLKLSDLKVSIAGNTAVLTGLNTATSTAKQVLKFRFTDTFLWRQGRWQAISSQASRVK